MLYRNARADLVPPYNSVFQPRETPCLEPIFGYIRFPNMRLIRTCQNCANRPCNFPLSCDICNGAEASLASDGDKGAVCYCA